MFGLEIVVIFVVIWWLVLFTVLPFGVQKDDKVVGGNDPGAPKNPKIAKKFIITTIISTIIFLVIYYLVKIDFLNLRKFLQ